MAQKDAIKSRILVIDDESSILNALEFFLEQEGYETEVSTSFSGYRESSESTAQPDLIILDILLGNEDGRKIAKELKADTPTKDIPILMISAHPDVANMAQEAGADSYLAKPFTTDTLLESINGLLQVTSS